MLKEINTKRASARQTCLLEVDEHSDVRPEKQNVPMGKYEQACCDELDRIQAKLDELGVLLRELIQASTPKSSIKQSYSTHDIARILGKRPFTVREWCRLGRINAKRAMSGRGVDKEWRITHQELERIQNDGLLPTPKRY